MKEQNQSLTPLALLYVLASASNCSQFGNSAQTELRHEWGKGPDGIDHRVYDPQNKVIRDELFVKWPGDDQDYFQRRALWASFDPKKAAEQLAHVQPGIVRAYTYHSNGQLAKDDSMVHVNAFIPTFSDDHSYMPNSCLLERRVVEFDRKGNFKHAREEQYYKQCKNLPAYLGGRMHRKI